MGFHSSFLFHFPFPLPLILLLFSLSEAVWSPFSPTVVALRGTHGVGSRTEHCHLIFCSFSIADAYTLPGLCTMFTALPWALQWPSYPIMSSSEQNNTHLTPYGAPLFISGYRQVSSNFMLLGASHQGRPSPWAWTHQNILSPVTFSPEKTHLFLSDWELKFLRAGYWPPPWAAYHNHSSPFLHLTILQAAVRRLHSSFFIRVYSKTRNAC